MLRGETTSLHGAPVQHFQTSYSVQFILEPCENPIKSNTYKMVGIVIIYVRNQLYVNIKWFLHIIRKRRSYGRN
jgi:hypothetical protein